MSDKNIRNDDAGDLDAVDKLKNLSAESAGDPGSDDSPRATPADSAMGGILNSGPNDPGFAGNQEIAARGRASRVPGREAKARVPREDAEKTAPGDNLD